jgi:hypothetical protein
MNLAGGLRELLRPPPHRGPLIAAGAVALAVGVALEELRLDAKLGTGVHMVILLVSGALIYWLGVQSPNEGDEPPAYQSVLLVTGLLLLYPALLTTADVLGADFGFPAGAFVWTSLVALGLALWPALERNSAICLLLAAAFGAVALLSAWRFVFDASAQTPYRWLLLVVAAACALASLALREPAPRHAQQLVNAAGLAIAAIGLTAAAVRILGDVPAADGDLLPGVFEVVLLGAGFGLVAFGALDRSPGPAYLGVLNLALFIAAVGLGGQPSLYWWPLTLLLIGVVALGAGLRPRRPLPPEPRAYRAGEAPLAARADGEEIVVRVHEE